MKSRFALVVLALLMPSLLMLRPVSPANAISRNVGSSGPEALYFLGFVVATDSDWTTVRFDGISPFSQNATITSGNDAPGLHYSVQPGFISISKRQYDETLITLEAEYLLLRGNDTGEVHIGKGHIGQTRVTIHIYTGSWQQYTSFIHVGVNQKDPVSNTRTFAIDWVQLYASPAGSATLDPVPANLERSVMAFYYPWYGNPAGPSRRWVHWGEGYAHHPLFGLYDSKDERVIEAHLRMAQASGIDGFIVSWWGPHAFEDDALQVILTTAESFNFSITIYYESYRPWLNGDLPISQVVDELSYAVSRYSENRAFLKVDGKPVLFIYNVGAWGRSPSYWHDIRKELEQDVGPVYLVGDVQVVEYADAFDGFHWYAAPDINVTSQMFGLYSEKLRLGLKGVDWGRAVECIRSGEALPLEYRFLAFTVHPGFDLTKIGGSLYADREGGQLYMKYWEKALLSNADGILITSWNEWHEGTEIEPSTEYEFSYLQSTRQQASRYKEVGAPPVTPELGIHSALGDKMPSGVSDVLFSVVNDSPYGAAVYVKLAISLDEGLSLTDVQRTDFYSYAETRGAHLCMVVIPLLRESEGVSVTIELNASIGFRKVTAVSLGYSALGTSSAASLTRQFEVVAPTPTPTVLSPTPPPTPTQTPTTPFPDIAVASAAPLAMLVELVLRRRKRI